MKKFRNYLKLCVLVLVLSLVAPSVLPISGVVVARAATIKLNTKKLTLDVGASKTLKVAGTIKKVTWSSSKKSVATVSKVGKVTAISAGKAKITAVVNKKKLSCTVTVKEVKVVNPFVATAPFDAQEVTSGKISYVIPKDWTNSIYAETSTIKSLIIYPTSADLTKGTSNVVLTIQETGTPKVDYSAAKEYFENVNSKEAITSSLAQQGINATIEDYKVTDYKATLGTAVKFEYKVVSDTITFNGCIYYLWLDNYVVVVTMNDYAEAVTPSVSSVGEYILNSIQVTK